MADFFSSALDKTSQPYSTSPLGCSFGIEALLALSHDIVGPNYEDLSKFFPQNPKFMFGADKLLLVAVKIAQAVDAHHIVATNLSVSKGIALLALQDRTTLESIGLSIEPLR